VAQSHPSLRPGNGAAFSVEMGGEERLVIAQEAEPRRQTEWQPVIAGIREVVSEEFEIQPAAILLLKPGSIPKTSMGKYGAAPHAPSSSAATGRCLQTGAQTLAKRRVGSTRHHGLESTGPASLESWLQERVAAMLRMAPVSVDGQLSADSLRRGFPDVRRIDAHHRDEPGRSAAMAGVSAEFESGPTRSA
jgi:hypothetical protein